MNVPRGRRDDLLTTKLDDEVVVYDPETKQAHSLNRLAVSVWNHADDAETVADLRAKVSTDVGVPVNEAAVLNALQKLERAHLLLDKVATSGPLTRREILRKGGKLSAAVAVTPIIASALVPMAAAAASFVCSVGVPGCQQSPTCGPDCFCFATDATGVCFNDFFCGTSPACNTSATCPSGTFCAISTCCAPPPGFEGFCAPRCNGSGTPVGPTQHGSTAAGKTL